MKTKSEKKVYEKPIVAKEGAVKDLTMQKTGA